MPGPSVLQSPKSYDYFTLDGERSPGIARILSGGDIKIEIQDQQQPLTLGANTVVRSRKNIVVRYGFRLWLPGHFQQRDRWIAKLMAGSQSTTPMVYNFQDLNIPWLSRVIFEGMAPQKPIKPGGPWDWELELHQWVRIKTAGGVVRPKNALEQLIEKTSAENNALQKQLDGLNAASAARKAAARQGK